MFNVGGTNGQPITVVANSLEGHSGLIDMAALSSDPRFAGVFVQDVAVHVADNDEAGMVVAYPNGPLRVFEQREAGEANVPSNLVVSSYLVVLTRAPEETVQVTASVVPISERDRRAGGKGIALCVGTGVCTPATASDAGVTLQFSRTNWWIPQAITVIAPPDELSEGTRTAIIQHRIVQGASPDDGGAYDNLQVLSTSVTVIDDDAADVLPVQVDASGRPDNTLLVAEDVNPTAAGSLPYTDAYQVILTRKPTDEVDILVSSDGQTQIWDGTDYVQSITLTFDETTWSTPQIVRVRATHDTAKEGLHFSRITNTLDTADLPKFLALNLSDVAAGLAAAVNADTTGRVSGTSSGSQVTIDSTQPFTAAITGGTIDDSASTFAYLGDVTVSLSTTASIVVGHQFAITLDGITYRYAAQTSDDYADIAQNLALAVHGSSRFDGIYTSGTGFTVRQRTGQAFVASMDASDGSLTANPTVWINAATPITDGGVWSIVLDGVSYDFTAHTGDTHATIASALANLVDASSAFETTYRTGDTIFTVQSAQPFVATMDAADGTFSGGRASSGTGKRYASAVFNLTYVNGSVIHANDFWQITLNDGTAAELGFSYVAGHHGEDTEAKPEDVTIADDDAPSVLVTQSGGSTNVIEPTQFVVLGNGLVTALVDSTHFRGDFGTSVVNEVDGDNTRLGAMNLDLGKWSSNADTDIGLLPLKTANSPHITVNGTGNGESDWYKFSVDAAGREASFDIDHGYDPGDPILWLSLLRLYNEHGDLLAQGPGFSNPTDPRSGLGSTTWLDDYLEYTFGAAGTYYLEVTSWLLSSGLPIGVDYQLQVQVENHPTAGFLFAPQPVLENEIGNNTTPQQITQNDFFQFFDPNVGDRWLTGGTIDWMTPYARIQGSGDGSFDLYSFEVTSAMVNPSALTSLVALDGSVPDANGPFFTDVSLRLSGRVTPGDMWTLGLRYRDYFYTAVDGDTLATVAQHLGSQLPSRYTVDWTTTPGVLRIQDSLGFNLTGLTANGISQNANAAATVSRIQNATTTDGNDITFTTATITLGGTAAPGETWTLVIDGHGYDKTTCDTSQPPVCTTDLTQIASALAGQVTGATPNGSTITITRSTAFSLAFRISGASPQGTASFDGTPTQTQAPLIQWTTERITLPAPTVRPGRDVGGRDQRRHAGDGHGGERRHRPDTFAVTPRHRDRRDRLPDRQRHVTITRATPFTADVTVTVSGKSDTRRRRLADDEDRDALERLPGDRRLARDALERRDDVRYRNRLRHQSRHGRVNARDVGEQHDQRLPRRARRQHRRDHAHRGRDVHRDALGQPGRLDGRRRHRLPRGDVRPQHHERQRHDRGRQRHQHHWDAGRRRGGRGCPRDRDQRGHGDPVRRVRQWQGPDDHRAERDHLRADRDPVQRHRHHRRRSQRLGGDAERLAGHR